MFKDILRFLRKINNYSMDELCDIYNKRFNGKLNKGTLSRYENGLQEPLFTVVKNFSELFDVTVDYMVSDIKNGFPENPNKPQLCKIFDSCHETETDKLVAKLLQLDEKDRGRIEERIDILLEDDKYSRKKEKWIG